MKDAFVIEQPWITEKSTALNAAGKYVFIVKPSATKNEVKKAVHDIYKVNPISVNIVRKSARMKRFRAGYGRKPGYKKAIVTLRAGEKIDLGR